MPVPGHTSAYFCRKVWALKYIDQKVASHKAHIRAGRRSPPEAGACLMKSRRSSIQRARELRLIMDRYSSIVKRQPSLQIRCCQFETARQFWIDSSIVQGDSPACRCRQHALKTAGQLQE